MPTPDSGGLTHLDLNDPKDVQYLVDTGYAWRSGPKSLQRIFRLIVTGAVKRAPTKETPEVTAYLDKFVPLTGPSPVEPTTEAPVAPPTA